MRRVSTCIVGLALCACTGTTPGPRGVPSAAPATSEEISLDLSRWRPIPSQSGSVSYYAILSEAGSRLIRARYRPPYETVVLGYPVEGQGTEARRLRWRWRARQFPSGGRACEKGRGDAAASVYVTWKRGLRWYSLKYAWSTGVPEGTTCQDRRGLFVAQDTIVLASGGPLGVWRTEEVDLASDFRMHFEDGDPQARVPRLAGVGILTDGDQTESESAADYSDFVLLR